MMVRVRLFARARDLAGVDRTEIELGANATVSDVRKRISDVFPAMRDLLGQCAVAVDEDFAGDDVVVTERSEIAVIPPVSGG